MSVLLQATKLEVVALDTEDSVLVPGDPFGVEQDLVTRFDAPFGGVVRVNLDPA